MPLTNCPLGSELTIEPFRWDQRFFLITLNMLSIPFQESNSNTFIPYATSNPINSMCEVTGGRSYLISTQRMLFQCLESLVAKMQAGVVINFEKIGNDPAPITKRKFSLNYTLKPAKTGMRPKIKIHETQNICQIRIHFFHVNYTKLKAIFLYGFSTVNIT